MKILVIGGTGHIGQHLVPMLLECGYDVAVTARGNRPMPETFKNVKYINCDCGKYESIKELSENEKFDVVVDFPGMAGNAWRCFRDAVSHIVACGSLWMWGNPKIVPTPELAQSKCEFDGYEIRYNRIQQIIAEEKNYNATFTAIMPPNICGPGKIPLDTMGGRSIEVHRSNMRGETVYLPDGAEALISPCDALDLAQLFLLAIVHRDEASGQIFNGGSGYALTSSEFVNTMANIYGVKLPIEYVSWEHYRKINPDKGAWWHFYSHMCPDISKAKKLLGYTPKYKPEEALERAVNWMRENKLL